MTVEYKRLVMAGPLRWVVLSKGEEVTTFAFLAKVHYTVQGQGNVLFVRSDLSGDGTDDVFGVFADNLALPRYLRDEIFSYTVFAGPARQGSPAPIVEATFESTTFSSRNCPGPAWARLTRRCCAAGTQLRQMTDLEPTR